jgi:hypothetical protein
MAQRIDRDHQIGVYALVCAKFDGAVESGLPAFVADEVTVFDQEARSPDDVEQFVRQNCRRCSPMRVDLGRRREAVEVKRRSQRSHELVGGIAEELGTVD